MLMLRACVWVTEALGNDANHFLFASRSMPKPEKRLTPCKKTFVCIVKIIEIHRIK